MSWTDGSKPSYYSCLIVWRHKPGDTDTIEFLVIDSETLSPRTGESTGNQVKFPGGMNRVDDEPPAVTAAREFLEETHMSVDMTHALELQKIEVHNRNHVKYGYLISAECCTGTLRSEVLTDADDMMQPPRWDDHLWLANQAQPRAHVHFRREAIRLLQRMGIITR